MVPQLLLPMPRQAPSSDEERQERGRESQRGEAGNPDSAAGVGVGVVGGKGVAVGGIAVNVAMSVGLGLGVPERASLTPRDGPRIFWVLPISVWAPCLAKGYAD
jgi:hypothetical protein